MKRNESGFRLFYTVSPFHPFGKEDLFLILPKVIGYQPVFMLFYVVFQKLVSYDNIFSDQLIKVLYAIPRKLTIVSNHLQCKIDSRHAGLALAKTRYS